MTIIHPLLLAPLLYLGLKLGVRYARDLLDGETLVADELIFSPKRVRLARGSAVTRIREYDPLIQILVALGAVSAITAWTTVGGTMAVILTGVTLFCIPMIVIDLVDYIIPNEISFGVLGLAGVATLIVGLQDAGALSTDSVNTFIHPSGGVTGAFQGMFIMFLLYGLLHMISEDFGMGDVKLSASVGMILGLFGLEYVVAGFFATFLSAIIISILAASIAERKFTASQTIAFGPYMFIGTMLAFPLAPVVSKIYEYIG